MPRPAESSEPVSDPREFRRSLQRWFRLRGRDLPWRRTRDPYAILVSEFMLQQTQVATVIPYYVRWLARFPDFSALARAKESDVLHAWQGLGYYARARHLHAAGKFVRENFLGQLPAAPAAIAQLPGVGRYTAGAIASFAFDLPEPIVEANIGRVLARLTNWQAPIDSATGRAHLWQTAQTLLPRKDARAHNSALMDLGALICVPRTPRCGECPVRRFCRAQQPALLPLKRKRPRTIALFEPHTFAQRRNRVLLEQSSDRWRGMWILPRLARRPKEIPLLQIDFPFTHHRVTLAVFAGPEAKRPNDKQRWFPRQALARLPLPSPHRRALALLLSAAGPARTLLPGAGHELPRLAAAGLAPEASGKLAGGVNHRGRDEKGGQPREGRRRASRLPTPLPGRAILLAENRWLAPPAKIPCPSGTSLPHRHSKGMTRSN